jgi:hypothetical protein
MSIHHVGHSLLHTPVCSLQLHNILLALQANKYLLFVHWFTCDNHVFFEFHPFHFLVKDSTMRIPLPCDRCVGGLYPLSFHGASKTPAALLSPRPSLELWHQQLGHLGSSAIHHILKKNNLLVSSLNKQSRVCTVCQMSKSHQLPCPLSNSISTTPLQLVHTDVCGPAMRSANGSRYYVSFIDDFSRFLWIYTLKYKSDVHHVFLEF